MKSWSTTICIVRRLSGKDTLPSFGHLWGQLWPSAYHLHRKPLFEEQFPSKTSDPGIEYASDPAMTVLSSEERYDACLESIWGWTCLWNSYLGNHPSGTSRACWFSNTFHCGLQGALTCLAGGLLYAIPRFRIHGQISQHTEAMSDPNFSSSGQIEIELTMAHPLIRRKILASSVILEFGRTNEQSIFFALCKDLSTNTGLLGHWCSTPPIAGSSIRVPGTYPLVMPC